VKNRNNNFKFFEMKEIKEDDYKQLINLILKENPEALLASLSFTNIKIYLQKVIESDNLSLFVLKKKNTIVAYAVIAKKVSSLILIFSNMKLKIFLNLITKLKFIKIFNILLSYLRLDVIMITKEKKKIINTNYNLNLLAVKKNFQSKGIGTFFLKKVFKKIKNSKYITVESLDKKAYDFYCKKHKFLFLAEKYRIIKNLKILVKKLT